MNSPVQARDLNNKREHYLEWAEYFMATAFLAAKRSKDPCSQVGACIVNEDNIIVGIGYNGMPKGCNDDEFPWAKGSKLDLENKYLYVCHAELNAVLNKNSVDVRNCTIYVGLFPCNECAKVIIQSGIRQVIYMSDKHAHKRTTIASKRMLDAVGVKYSQFTPKNRKITIDFDEINWNDQSQVPASPIVQNESPRRMDSFPLRQSVVKHINLEPSTSNNPHAKKTKYEDMNRSLDEAKLTPEEVHVKNMDAKDL